MYRFVINRYTLSSAEAVVAVTTDYKAAHDMANNGYAAICRSHGIASMADAEKVADLCNAAKHNGRMWIATDAGPHVSPRYDVTDVPAVDDAVSYTINGDYYPAGKITRISKGPLYRRIEAQADNGAVRVFWRRGGTGCWKHDGVWNLVAGTHHRLNPEF